MPSEQFPAVVVSRGRLVAVRVLLGDDQERLFNLVVDTAATALVLRKDLCDDLLAAGHLTAFESPAALATAAHAQSIARSVYLLDQLIVVNIEEATGVPFTDVLTTYVELGDEWQDVDGLLGWLPSFHTLTVQRIPPRVTIAWTTDPRQHLPL